MDSTFISLLFTFRSISLSPPNSFHKSFQVTFPGEYLLFFANCIPISVVTMDVRTELFNINDGATKDYLSASQTQLPSLYFIISLIYLCLLGFWIYTCFKNKRLIHRIHLLMAVLLVTKALSLTCVAEYKHYVKVSGTDHGWSVLSYVFKFINVVVFFTVIVLIGAGWPYMKPYLTKKEKVVLIGVITLQIVANVASVVVDESGPYAKNWVTWNQVCLLADFICCCAVVYSIVWLMRNSSRTGAKSARYLIPFRRFCVVVIGYLLVTRVGVFGLKIAVDYGHLWMCILAEEIAGLVLYSVVFYIVEEGEYYFVDGKGGEYDEEATEMVKG